MLRLLAIAAMLALAVPVLAVAQEHHDEHHPGGPPPHGAPPHPGPGPGMHPGPGPHPGPMAGPHPGGPPGPHGQFTFHGHAFNRVHLDPFVYPHGWEYRRWVIGAALPPLFLAPAYYYRDWAAMGLAPPEPGFQWVRYGPDLLLVNVATGQVVDTVYDAFY
jgi:hypothetical protein